MSKPLRLAISLMLLGLFAWRMNWDQIGKMLDGLRLEYWLLAVLLYAITQVVSALRWQLLARPLGFDRPLTQFVSFYFIGMFFNLLLPTSVGGDVVRAWYLDDRRGHRLAAFLSVFVDRFSGLLVLLALACLATCFCPIALPPWIPVSVWGTAGCAVLGLLLMPQAARKTTRLQKLGGLIDGCRNHLCEPQLLFVSTCLSVLVQAANVMLVWLVGLALGAAVPAGYYWIVVPMVTLLTLAPISLNGMGVREGGMVLFLAPVGVDEATAVSLAFLWFMVFAATSLAGAGLYLFGTYPRPEEGFAHGPVDSGSDQGRTGQLKAAA